MKVKASDGLWRQPKWRLLVFRKVMAQVSAALVICALIAGLYRQRVYFVFACCAAGTMLLAAAWFIHCRWRDGKPLRRRARGVPSMLRPDKPRRAHRPAFLMNSEDFDDDLTPCTTAADEDFSEAACAQAQVAARVIAGIVMLVLSALIST